jgi:hypothetical protein
VPSLPGQAGPAAGEAGPADTGLVRREKQGQGDVIIRGATLTKGLGPLPAGNKIKFARKNRTRL